MSKITDMARAEAERAEAEAGQLPTQEPEPEPEPGESEPAPPSEPEVGLPSQEQLAKFEKENERHERELVKLMGEDFEAFEPCPECGSVGFRPVQLIPLDQETERCSNCQGHGVLRTGSVNEANVVRACGACQGTGFRYKTPETPPPGATRPQPWRFDPVTGQPLAGGEQGNGPAAPGGWAPGYVPPGQPLPASPPAA